MFSFSQMMNSIFQAQVAQPWTLLTADSSLFATLSACIVFHSFLFIMRIDGHSHTIIASIENYFSNPPLKKNIFFCELEIWILSRENLFFKKRKFPFFFMDDDVHLCVGHGSPCKSRNRWWHFGDKAAIYQHTSPSNANHFSSFFLSPYVV